MNRFLLFTLFFSVFTYFNIQAQEVEEESEFAEPIFKDNTTDFGAGTGSIELNYIPSFQRNDNFALFQNGVEIEYVIKKGFGVEVEFGMFSFQPNGGERSNYLTNVELATQYTILFDGTNALAAGVEVGIPVQEYDVSPIENNLEFEPFVTYARRLPIGLDVQANLSGAFEREANEFEVGLNYNLAAIYALDDFFIGFELNGVMGEEQSLAFSPQLGVEIGNLTLAVGASTSLAGNLDVPPLFLARIIYELDKD